MGPTLYLVMESDLHPKSVVNLLLKYTDDTNLLVPENTDVELVDEYMHVMQWSDDNKMITRIWANVQRDGRPAEYRFRRLFNAAKFG